ncbi:MAG: hypothetical protein IPH38_09030 [Candidatus Microthrix sp.]|nr:hypothetical protein [Candidatus Microthrix sp.]MBK7019717.1 hypothetical protein [Candidatus Microthrix sp.]
MTYHARWAHDLDEEGEQVGELIEYLGRATEAAAGHARTTTTTPSGPPWNASPVSTG